MEDAIFLSLFVCVFITLFLLKAYFMPLYYIRKQEEDAKKLMGGSAAFATALWLTLNDD